MGLDLIIKAKEKDRDEQLYQLWLAQLPIMAVNGKTIGFKEYLEKVTRSNIDKRPTRELLAELDEIEKQFEVMKDGDGNI